MSFLFGGGRRQPSSAEKLAMAEAEMEMSMTLFQGYYHPSPNMIAPPANQAQINKLLRPEMCANRIPRGGFEQGRECLP